MPGLPLADVGPDADGDAYSNTDQNPNRHPDYAIGKKARLS